MQRDAESEPYGANRERSRPRQADVIGPKANDFRAGGPEILQGTRVLHPERRGTRGATCDRLIHLCNP